MAASRTNPDGSYKRQLTIALRYLENFTWNLPGCTAVAGDQSLRE